MLPLQLDWWVFLHLLQIPRVVFLDCICQWRHSLYLGLTNLFSKDVKKYCEISNNVLYSQMQKDRSLNLLYAHISDMPLLPIFSLYDYFLLFFSKSTSLFSFSTFSVCLLFMLLVAIAASFCLPAYNVHFPSTFLKCMLISISVFHLKYCFHLLMNSHSFPLSFFGLVLSCRQCCHIPHNNWIFSLFFFEIKADIRPTSSYEPFFALINV